MSFILFLYLILSIMAGAIGSEIFVYFKKISPDKRERILFIAILILIAIILSTNAFSK